MRQVLVNLLSNAIKFTESGEIAVRVEMVRQEKGRITIRFSVSDTGIGISHERQHRLFQSFSQLDTATTRKYGGSGLGLAISRRIVELMSGSIGVQSKLGEGSTFWFELPFSGGSEASAESSGTSQLAGCRMLIVDDNATNRDILAEYAADWGVIHSTASSVEEALSAVNRAEAEGTPYHLVLTDYCMPGRNGLDN